MDWVHRCLPGALEGSWKHWIVYSPLAAGHRYSTCLAYAGPQLLSPGLQKSREGSWAANPGPGHLPGALPHRLSENISKGVL